MRGRGSVRVGYESEAPPMFFRNPHYFAAQNADLFMAYVELFGYDTRLAWTEDFPHYVNANRSFYASGQIPPKTKLTIPE